MGPCQGRGCSLTVTEIVAERRGISAQAAGRFTARFPAKPVPLADIASLPHGREALDCVVR
jgi:hypothetical protein